jgi:hypothetical protein
VALLAAPASCPPPIMLHRCMWTQLLAWRGNVGQDEGVRLPLHLMEHVNVGRTKGRFASCMPSCVCCGRPMPFLPRIPSCLPAGSGTGLGAAPAQEPTKPTTWQPTAPTMHHQYPRQVPQPCSCQCAIVMLLQLASHMWYLLRNLCTPSLTAQQDETGWPCVGRRCVAALASAWLYNSKMGYTTWEGSAQ